MTVSEIAPVRTGRVVVQGLVATAVAVVLNVAVGLALRAALGVDEAFLPLTPGAIAFFTLLSSLAGVVAYLIVRRWSARAFPIIAFGVAAVSLAGPLNLLRAGDADWEGLTTGAALALIPLHILPAVVLVVAFRRRQ
ncbi:hypothetical protein AMIS_46870 [Actinoplanes missouriensis 431]|uniref:Uncharacterized protein n=1 Tax=Actinoplanes missouriensis (strain ATCC 14538 / DSM 43046 / CBS 188.64 / JCM 3121 / NBRC 102363 / NCIMB 12654 / NRRL B-3342 / UNCC 431) TaxID=512565 RepID=I0HA70_ACTM4|nr:DUF6069 family protein [Actinoplanes missouriensis]BAL89907.1 hypothetical protein AMIS_46870 [Actinoplanes missouriensis 431]